MYDYFYNKFETIGKIPQCLGIFLCGGGFFFAILHRERVRRATKSPMKLHKEKKKL